MYLYFNMSIWILLETIFLRCFTVRKLAVNNQYVRMNFAGYGLVNLKQIRSGQTLT